MKIVFVLADLIYYHKSWLSPKNQIFSNLLLFNNNILHKSGFCHKILNLIHSIRIDMPNKKNYTSPESEKLFKKVFQTLLSSEAEKQLSAAIEMRVIRNRTGYDNYLNFIKKSVSPHRFDRILEILDSPERDVRLEGVLLLRSIKVKKVKNRLVLLLEHDLDSYVRSAVVINIGLIGTQSDIPLISKYLDDDDHRVRANSVEALGMINDACIIDYIKPFLADPNNRVKANAVKLMYRFNKMELVYPALKNMINSDSNETYASALYLLREIDTLRSIEIMFSPDEENLVLDSEQKLDLLQNVESREKIDKSIKQYEMDKANLDKEVERYLNEDGSVPGYIFESYLEVCTKLSGLKVHRVYLPTLSGMLEKQLEIEKLNTALEKSHEQLSLAKSSLEAVNTELEKEVERQTGQIKTDSEYRESILRSLNSGLLVIDHNYRIKELNPAGREITFLTENVKNEFVDKFFPIAKFKPYFENLFNKKIINQRVEISFLDAKRKNIDIGLSVGPLKSNDNKILGAIAVFQNITHIKELEKRLAQAEKMKTIGVLTSSISHDFNNLLMGIIGFSSVLLSDFKENPEATEGLEVIHESALQAKEIVKQLLSISRDNPPLKQSVNIEELVTSSMSVIKLSIPQRIEIQTDFSEKCSSISADPNQLKQVIINLVINAKDSILDEGVIKIRTYKENIMPHETIKGTPSEFTGDFSVLEISDTGTGIPDEVKDNIFDPFFSTKPSGHGTGLGCTIIYNIIRKHGGFVDFDTIKGSGTTFKLHIPIIKDVVKGTESNVSGSVLNLSGKKVLVVEDELVTGKYLSRIIKRLGAECTLLNSGLDVFNTSDVSSYDLIIMDVMLSDMDGITCLENLGEEIEISDMPILFMSGHTAGQGLAESYSSQNSFFINKPFTYDNLIGALQKLRIIDKR